MMEPIPILGVAGRPVLHSMSPAIFRELFRASRVEAAYSRVAASSAVEAVAALRSLGMRGLNLTAPLKEEALALADELSPEARALGAVNCLVASDGRIRGANTDPAGVLGALRGIGAEGRGRSCLVIGAGGAARAAAWALASAGGKVVVANRTRKRAEELAIRFGCRAAGLEELPSLASSAEIIVSTLSSDFLPDPESWLPRSAIYVLDADYKTGALARSASARGLAVATGADWLACQALPAYELFMGRPPELGPTETARLLGTARRAYEPGRKIALVGLMGAGKSRSGEALAESLGLAFVDLDQEIGREAGASIPEIFRREGESGFRERELRVLDRITSISGPAVLAAGGGAPTSAASAAILRERCLCVWLLVSPATAADRTRGGGRPLLEGFDPQARLASLEAERRGAYAACSGLIVSTEGREPEAVAEVIHDEIARLS
jgi:shikimate dehydrogenase